MGRNTISAPCTPSARKFSGTLLSLHISMPTRPRGVSTGASSLPGVMNASPAVCTLLNLAMISPSGSNSAHELSSSSPSRSRKPKMKNIPSSLASAPPRFR